MPDVVVVTNKGLELVVDALIAANTHKYLGWGTGATAADVANTGLQFAAAPTTTTAVTGTISQVTTSTPGDTYQVVATITAAGSLAITEVVILNQATISGAGCLLRGTFDPINVNSGDSIEFTIKVQFYQEGEGVQ